MAYGQTTPIDGGFERQEPAEVYHQWACHNKCDIGCSFGSPYIWLFARTDGQQNGMEHYPMLV
jgi:hypothetical protein